MNTTTQGLIVYFDATRVRRDKMRQMATQPTPQPLVAGIPPIVEKGVVPSPVAVVAGPVGPSQEELQAYLVSFVVEQTGYPEDFVTMDADLESDLGIDSIKKAQLLGELNEMFHFSDPRSEQDSGMSLDDFTTLRDISGFITSRLNGQSAANPASEPVAATVAPMSPDIVAESFGPSQEEIQAYLVNFVIEQTGYPEDFVTMDADLEGDLGIDSIKKAQLLGELNEMFHFSDPPSEQDSGMSLDDFTTLRDISSFIASRLSGQAALAAPVEEKFAFLKDFLINFVIEQTGFPMEMVTLDADLESDLGIDSIKKAQLFGELINIVDIVPVETMSLDDFKTLGDIYNHVVERS